MAKFQNWQNFELGIPTCLYLKTLKFVLPPMRNINESEWNVGCVGSPGIGARVRHVHFMLFVSISFCWVANANAVFSGIWA